MGMKEAAIAKAKSDAEAFAQHQTKIGFLTLIRLTIVRLLGGR